MDIGHHPDTPWISTPLEESLKRRITTVLVNLAGLGDCLSWQTILISLNQSESENKT